MTIADIEQEFGRKYEQLITEYRSEYKARIETLLKKSELCNIDVKNLKTGKTGRLIICRDSDAKIRYVIKFVPYRKDGNLSSKYENIYYYIHDEDEIVSLLTKTFEAVCVKENDTPKYKYEVSLETPNILESGSTFSKIKTTYDENEAFKLLADGRNRLERTGKIDGKVVTQIYDLIDKQWH